MKNTFATLFLVSFLIGCEGGEEGDPGDAAPPPQMDAAPAKVDAPPAADTAPDLAPVVKLDGPQVPEVTPETAPAERPADEAGLPQLPKEDYTCQTDADCCVVHAACADTLVLVTAKNRAQAEAAYAAMPRPVTPDGGIPSCWPCVPPPVEVSCQAGRCRARQVAHGPDTNALAGPHCGSRLRPADGGAPKAFAIEVSSSALTAEEPVVDRFRCH